MDLKRTPKPAAADDSLDDLFSGIGETKKIASRPARATGGSTKDDILADLESQLGEGTSRPHTPRVAKEPTVRKVTAPPPVSVVDDSRKSTDSTRSGRPTFTPSATSSEHHESDKKSPTIDQTQASGGGGGWWGGLLSTASATANAAMKQANAAYKDLQQNEDAKKWADQVRGAVDVGAIKHFGDELRSRAMPTFSDLLNTIAPPISSHERLMIHITHDLVGYPSLDPLIYGVFARVMSQVEGGDLVVVQRGQESGSKRTRESSAGWRDGPWWRHVESTRELGTIKGMVEGTKLCRAGAESYAHDYFATVGGVESAKLRANEELSETNPVRTSDLFLAVQAIEAVPEATLFAKTASAAAPDAQDPAEEAESTVCFAIFILDPVHEIEFATISQAVPTRWVRWLDATNAPDPLLADSKQAAPYGDVSLPDEIRDIVESGAVDPREWIAEWLEETLTLSVGVVAQRYVARRMGVGEGGAVKGKAVDHPHEQTAAEEARAGLL